MKKVKMSAAVDVRLNFEPALNFVAKRIFEEDSALGNVSGEFEASEERYRRLAEIAIDAALFGHVAFATAMARHWAAADYDTKFNLMGDVARELDREMEFDDGMDDLDV